MILRVMRGRGTPAEVASLRKSLAASERDIGRRPGLERFHLGWRRPQGDAGGTRGAEDEREVVVVSHWSSAEAAADADRAGTSPVTFVSAWGRLPTDRDLHEAFWPDIALRYDEFVVEVYSSVGVE